MSGTLNAASFRWDDTRYAASHTLRSYLRSILLHKDLRSDWARSASAQADSLAARRYGGTGLGLVLPESQRPQPWRSHRRGRSLHDATDDSAIGENVVIVIAPELPPL